MLHAERKRIVPNARVAILFLHGIVGSPEADVKRGLISDESPVGRALIGHKVGDEVVAETPSGEIVFKILEIF